MIPYDLNCIFFQIKYSAMSCLLHQSQTTSPHPHSHPCYIKATLLPAFLMNVDTGCKL